MWGPSAPPPLICARAGTATSPINAVIAATPTTRMECSLILVWRQPASQAIRLACFRRRHPVVPDRAAFGATPERQHEANQADDDTQTTQHGASPRPYHTAPARGISSK